MLTTNKFLLLIVILIIGIFKALGDTTLDSIRDLGPREGMRAALEYYEIHHPEIVHAQAIQETGNFTSKLSTRHGNCFGLYNSRRKKYFKYSDWTESVKDYKEKIQNRHKPGEDYFSFLRRIKYAANGKQYVRLLKKIILKYRLESID